MANVNRVTHDQGWLIGQPCRHKDGIAPAHARTAPIPSRPEAPDPTPTRQRSPRSAWNAGIRYFDTAPHYGLGLSERRLAPPCLTDRASSSSYPRRSGGSWCPVSTRKDTTTRASRSPTRYGARPLSSGPIFAPHGWSATACRAPRGDAGAQAGSASDTLRLPADVAAAPASESSSMCSRSQCSVVLTCMSAAAWANAELPSASAA